MTLQKAARVCAEFLIVGTCTLVFVFTILGICAALLTGHDAGERDFVTYWSSGHQLVQHADPYDRRAILGIEHSAGFPDRLPAMIMRNPPPALLLVFPLGFFSIRTASLLWSLLLIASLLLSVRMISTVHDRRTSQLTLFAYVFAPALSCLMTGQMSMFVLLGLALFLRIHGRRPFLAGASLWFCILKPHLFLPFAFVLLVWIFVSKCYRLLFGFAIAVFVTTMCAAILDPSAWAHYGRMMRAAQIDREVIPCISMMLRRTVSPDSSWLQFLPAALGCLWAIVYFWKYRHSWNWGQHGSLLMLVSVTVAPYSWFMDQVVLLPALLHALYRIRSRSLIAVLALVNAVIGIANLRGIPLTSSALYLWTASAWLGWYLWATCCFAKDPPLSDRTLIGLLEG